MLLLATTCLGSFFFGMYFVKIFSKYRLILHHFRFDPLSLIIYTLSLVKRLFGNLGINISAIALALVSASPSALQMVYLLQQFFFKNDLCPINLNILSYTNLLGISITLLQLLCQALLPFQRALYTDVSRRLCQDKISLSATERWFDLLLIEVAMLWLLFVFLN